MRYSPGQIDAGRWRKRHRSPVERSHRSGRTSRCGCLELCRGLLLNCCLIVLGLLLGAAPVLAQEYEREPILYSKSEPHNRFSRLVERLEAGTARLDFEPRWGYLRGLLRELNISETSQVLVFSKTSLQRQRIAPRTPRAIYFNDDTYVGFCQQGEVIEVSAADPQLGTVFYTVHQQQAERPQVVRQGDNCLLCHASSQTKDVPGHLVRSVHADPSGMPILSAGTFRVDHTTPIENRWGGWYVSGTHGSQKHLGNLTFRSEPIAYPIDNAAGHNLTELKGHFNTSHYLTPHSDIVALMVLEHQAAVHNAIAVASFLTRQAMHHQQTLNRELKEPEDHEWESTRSRIKSACEPLVACLLLSGEAPLTAPFRGTSGFAEAFEQQGPRDQRGRSLRALDLEKQLFKFPCSYLIDCESMRALPPEAKQFVWTRIADILAGKETSAKYAHLTAEDRQAIVEILRDTLPEAADRLPAAAPTQ